MKKGTLVVLLILVGVGLVLGLTSCARKAAPPAETATTTPAAPAAPTPTPTPPAEPSTPPETPPATVLTEDIFAGSYEALQGLTSYRYTALFRFEHTEGNEIAAGSVSLEGEIGAPDAQHLSWSDLSTGEHFEVIRVGGQAWTRGGDGAWEEVPLEVADGLMRAVLVFAPAYAWNSLYADLPGASVYVGKEAVNGIVCLHYTSDYRGWGPTVLGGDLNEARGDVWIAEEGFPVKYIFSADGVDSQGKQGSVAWSMELKDVNQPISVEPPK